VFQKGFGIKIIYLIYMGSLSLGRPKWEGALGPKVAQEGRAPGGASRKLPPSPLAQP